MPVGKVLHRSRRSFLAKHRRTLSYGKVLPAMAAEPSLLMYSDSAVVLESEGEASPAHEKHDPLGLPHFPTISEGRSSKDSFDGRPSSSSMGDDDLLAKDLLHPQAAPAKRRSLLRKFRRSR